MELNLRQNIVSKNKKFERAVRILDYPTMPGAVRESVGNDVNKISTSGVPK